MKIHATLIAITLAVPSLAMADPLPKGAVPLGGDEITALYAGHSAMWKPGLGAYFSADNKVKGIATGTVFEGTWSISGNEICMTAHGWEPKTKSWNTKFTADCWRWVKAGAKVFTLYTKAWDGHKLDLIKGWYREDKNLKPGDLVSEKYAANIAK